jgi:hypothetical protein
VTRRDAAIDPAPDLTADTILGIVQQVLRETSGS